jgi:ribonuclease PH
MASSTRRTDILSLIHLRSDGRRPHEIRHMSCHLGALPSTTGCGSALPTSACSGSSLVTMGLTQVLCVVKGPCDVGRRSEELPDRYADKDDLVFRHLLLIGLTPLSL